MYEQLLPLFLILVAGWFWRILKPGGSEPVKLQRTINILALYLLIPAMVFPAVLHSHIDTQLFLVPATAWIVCISGLLLAVVSYRILALLTPVSRPVQGAMVQAVPQGDTLGIGLGVVVGMYGEEAAGVPIMYTLLAAMIYIWTIGVMAARYYGTRASTFTQLQELVRMPPLWALLLAWLLKLTGIPLPSSLLQTCELLSTAAIPLIIFSVGLSVGWHPPRRMLVMIPALFLRLVVCPGIAFLVGRQIGLSGNVLAATVISSAASCYVVGVMVADEYGLDTDLYAATLGISIPLFVLLAPLYGEWMSRLP